MNELIETIFSGFKVDNQLIPVSFLRYDGNSEAYITYQQVDKDGVVGGDDEIINYVDYYDFDIFVKKYASVNYFEIIESVKDILGSNGFTWRPERTSADLYEDDTNYFHKTLNFAYFREEN